MGQWTVSGDNIAQEGLGTNVRLTFGDVNGRDYEYALEARKTGGQEGFLILFRVKSEEDFYWCNLGGWGNARHGIERGNKGRGRWGTVGPVPDGKIEQDKWYRIQIRCEGPKFSVWLDDDNVIEFTDGRDAHPWPEQGRMARRMRGHRHLGDPGRILKPQGQNARWSDPV
jgi:alpha-N-arabinofuranosidase